MKKKIKKAKRLTAGSTSCPCPKCKSPSRVLRTSLGDRLVTSPRDRVIRERRCIGPARHRFHTEERPR